MFADTKVVTQDELRTKETEQLNFRDQTLKTKVRTKAIGQEELKLMKPEQKDFRADAIKAKVKTKAYREEENKVMFMIMIFKLRTWLDSHPGTFSTPVSCRKQRCFTESVIVWLWKRRKFETTAGILVPKCATVY